MRSRVGSPRPRKYFATRSLRAGASGRRKGASRRGAEASLAISASDDIRRDCCWAPRLPPARSGAPLGPRCYIRRLAGRPRDSARAARLRPARPGLAGPALGGPPSVDARQRRRRRGRELDEQARLRALLPEADPELLELGDMLGGRLEGVALEGPVVGQLALGEAGQGPVLGLGAQDLAGVAGEVVLAGLREHGDPDQVGEI